MITASRHHDFCAGHRVCGHENKCAHLHGHNYRAHFTCAPVEELDSLGRVVDFSVIKSRLCQWLEDNWDHKMLIWEQDPILPALQGVDPDGVRSVGFNPTAENMALHLLHDVGPVQLAETGARLISVTLEETRKCSATARLKDPS